jgi:hypothetical protein
MVGILYPFIGQDWPLRKIKAARDRVSPTQDQVPDFESDELRGTGMNARASAIGEP